LVINIFTYLAMLERFGSSSETFRNILLFHKKAYKDTKIFLNLQDLNAFFFKKVAFCAKSPK
jgi:hypothetical protein